MDQGNGNPVAIIMAGGLGTRFWPLSTKERPKQFIQLFDDRSLLQKSYDRLSGIVPDERIFVLTNDQFTLLVREQLPNLPPQNIIGEPERKDTGAAVCLGTLVAMKQFGNPVIVVLTADHLIEPADRFQKALISAINEAPKAKALYTFGIKPDYPATGYGYLEIGDKICDDDDTEHYKVVSFKEKPDSATADEFMKSGRYLWNSGMFVWSADAIFREMTLHLPEHVEHLTQAVKKIGSEHWQEALRTSFTYLNRISIDYAVMEKARDVRCVACEFSWKDVGGWLAIQNLLPHDANGNFVKGKIHALDAQDNLVFCDQPNEMLAIVGVSDMVVVRSGEKTLIANKNRLEDVKHVVEAMLTNPENLKKTRNR